MGLLSFYKTNQEIFDVNSLDAPLSIDLTRLLVGSTPLGKPPWDGEFFANALKKSGDLKMEQSGYELSLEGDVIKSAFLTLDKFQGNFLVNDKPVTLTSQTTQSEIRELFGSPYWTDHDDGEIILFYEYQRGKIELQFEFPDGDSLGYLTLIHEGILSCPEQRKSYGVDKPWPPHEK